MRYTSALLIVCLLWMFIGALFTSRYLDGEWYWCVFAAIIMIFLVIQIERQVILASKESKGLYFFRSIIALCMALIGTIIIDQIIFKDDIEQKKLLTMDEKVDTILPGRAKEIRRQVDELDSVILSKEQERKQISDDISKNPFAVTYETRVNIDTAGNRIVTRIRKEVDNPKKDLIGPLDANIARLRTDKLKKDSILLSLRPSIEADLKQNVGFLDELDVMYTLLSASGLSFCAWFIWFLFLLGLELFIVASKVGEKENDYDRLMRQQMDLHFQRIDLLSKQGRNNLENLSQGSETR